MISASEPLEFVPHGRTVLARHPGHIYSKRHNTSISEHSLLYKLTNFAIKDESLLEAKESDDAEWWCIREVYYRGDEVNKNNDTESLKDSKYEQNDSFRPPSRLKTDFNISIKSELMGKKDDIGSAGPSRGGSANSSSNMSKKFNLNSAQNKVPKTKPLNPKTDCSYEEELYVKGCTAVWSKGLISSPATKLTGAEHRETIACYTIDNPIKHAAFADFHVSINNTMLIDALNSQIGDVKKNIKIEDNTEHIESKVMPSILLIDNKCMRVFATDGREFITNIPFQVKKVWPMKYGVLLEKDATPTLHNSVFPPSFHKLNESYNSTFSKSRTLPNMSAKLRAESLYGYDNECPLPTCFSLAHPLDEVTPILMKSPSQGLQYYNDGDLQIIYVSTDPSIILIYDWKLGIHSLWKIRRATRDECLAMCPNLNNCSTVFSQTCDFVGSPMHSIGRNTTSLIGGSPFQSKRGLNTPNRSRQNSPMANIFHQQGLSPHASIGQASPSMISNTTLAAPPSLPLYPDICLDHIWTDSQVIRRDPLECPNDTKTFLHTDLVGHDFLCFIVKVAGVNKLQIMRLQKSHAHGQSTKTNLIVGSVSTVLAKDAVVLEHLKMIALIDESGNIILQSGNHVVGKVHVGGVLARLLASPVGGYGRVLGAFPRRSSLLPSRARVGAPPDDPALHLLSPVPHARDRSSCGTADPSALGVRGLCDAAGNRVTLSLETGQLYRIELPALACAALVARCCAALSATLPRDVTMQVVIRWYGVRNAPGTQDLTPEQEWLMFSNLLLTLLGYDLEKLNQVSDEEHGEVVTKKQRTSSDGTQDDWDYLLNSKLHKTIGNSLANMLNMNPIHSETKSGRTGEATDKTNSEKPAQFNTNSLLFPYTLQVFYSFHLLYEDIKLNTLLHADLKPLSAFLYQIAKDLRLEKYVNHYWLDFPTEYTLEFDGEESQMSECVLKKLVQPNYFCAEPPHIFSYFNSMFMEIDVGYYPYLADVNTMSRDIIEILSIAGYGSKAGVHTVSGRDSIAASTPRARVDACPPHEAARAALAVLTAVDRGITNRDIEQLPAALGLALLAVTERVRAAPPPHWPRAALALLRRGDLALQADVADKIRGNSDYMESLALEVLEKETVYTLVEQPAIEQVRRNDDSDTNTGMEHLKTKLLRLLYPRDHRMAEVFNLLQSSIPVTINLTQRPEVSDHDFIEEQEKHLYAISTRTMALPVARGMVTLRSLPCSPTEPLTLPKLCVSGRGPPPRCNTISLGGGDAAPHCLLWPTFHNGVAAGLALLPMTGSTIDSSWIIYNKPRGAQDMSTEHAGFLLALGLNGHLKDMPFMNMYEYLVKCNEMISVGLLLGLAATYRGTMDVQATKMMSIHLEPLLPPTSIELDIQQNILVAALLALGLLYQGTGHAHYAQVLLNEIGRPASGEAESCVEREGYALAAGLALGMVCLRSAPSAPSASAPSASAPGGSASLDRMAPRLRTYMLGGDRRTLTGFQKDKYKQGSSGAREGLTVNLDVTSPGATVALGLMYMRSNNQALAEWLEPPTTAYLLDFVRPDLLMLRVIARGLILWDSIEASEEWIESQVPDTIKPYCFVKPTEDNIDYEAMNQAYCNIVGGACFAVGLRFAGSGCEEARDAALGAARALLRAGRAASAAALAGGATLEACLALCLLAAGMIMAGRGDVEVLRVCRRLRARLPAPPAPAPHAPPPLTHGGQMAIHCTIGLLFLGGGRSTLSSTPEAVAALLAAFFPKFPTHSEDNRYHLQAFRHLYVLAVESRLILPRDLDTGKLCYAHIQVVDLSGAVKEMKAPCMIPELDRLREVRVSDPRYWPITFHRDHNWDQLRTFLNYTWCIDIKQRAGCLSYLDDPQGFLTIMAQTLTLDNANIWSVTPDNIELFTNDDKVRNFVKHYLAKEANVGANVCADCLHISKKRKGVKNEVLLPKTCVCRRYSKGEQEYVQSLSMVTYECVVKDILCALPIWTTFLKILKTMSTTPTSYHAWQMKLLASCSARLSASAARAMRVDEEGAGGGCGGGGEGDALVAPELALALAQRLAAMLDDWGPSLVPYLRTYLGLPTARKISSAEDSIKQKLAAFLVYHELPRGSLKEMGGDVPLAAWLGGGGGGEGSVGGRLSAEAVAVACSLRR